MGIHDEIATIMVQKGVNEKVATYMHDNGIEDVEEAQIALKQIPQEPS